MVYLYSTIKMMHGPINIKNNRIVRTTIERKQWTKMISEYTEPNNKLSRTSSHYSSYEGN